MTAMPDRPFRFTRVACTIVAMPIEHARPMVAELWLRGASAPVHARVRGRAAPGDGPLVVALGGARAGGGAIIIELSAGLGLDDAHAALCWAADHARELGVRSGALVLAAAGEGTALGLRLAARAAADGWPDIAEVVLER
jgi:hypothetical protein